MPELGIVGFLLASQRRAKETKTNECPYYLNSVSHQENPISLP